MVGMARNRPPKASAMVESLRGLGYSTPTAIADIVDNSISAGAKTIEISIEWASENSWIRIVDDGRGMPDSELEEAMQLGAKDPRDARASNDLGRFGMGLKTASFSQARSLTVASKTISSEVSCLRWDLDSFNDAKYGDWPLFEGPATDSDYLLSPLDQMASGTVVVWQSLDRVVTRGFGPDDMLELADGVDQHLGMTFHRLIEDKSVSIHLNGRPVQPWDPFMKGHPSKSYETTDYLLGPKRDVVVQCHVLPHKDRLSEKEFSAAAGPNGWTSQQGFYIYRNRRLLALGGWLRLRDARGRIFTRDEPHKLARLRLDIPNSADAEWNINIIKSTATPPVHLRADLQRLAAETRERARKVFAHRGRLIADASENSGAVRDVWSAYKKSDGTTYRISREHDLVRSILERSGPLKKDLEALIRLIEGTVPVQRIWLDTAEDNDPPQSSFDDAPDETVLETMNALFDALVHSSGLTKEQARMRIGRTNPFDRYPELVAQLGTQEKTT